MVYLEEFRKKACKTNPDWPGVFTLWEEYVMGDTVDPEEFKQILAEIKSSPAVAEPFGKHAESGLILWERIDPSSTLAHEIIKLIFDLQTTNSKELYAFALDYLPRRYPGDKNMNLKLQLTGLREGVRFESCISNYDLLTHIQEGNFVLHTGKWGIGEVMGVSLITGDFQAEFEYEPGVEKTIDFTNAFRYLVPVPKEHFLARRFGDPDTLEEEAKRDPLSVMHLLLKDLGPKTAAEIKDELHTLVIPEEDWSSWWQSARSKMKQDTLIETPTHIKQPFRLRDREVTHEERLQEALDKKPDANALIELIYKFIRDHLNSVKNESFLKSLTTILLEALERRDITEAHKIQILFFLENLKESTATKKIEEFVSKVHNFDTMLNAIEILANKKRFLTVVRQTHNEWSNIFLKQLFCIGQNALRDYLFEELKVEHIEQIKEGVKNLLKNPTQCPEMLLWYFQKVMTSTGMPLGEKEHHHRFLEAFFVLMNDLEFAMKNEEDSKKVDSTKDFIKKMHTFISHQRYVYIREIFKASSLEEAKELILLSSKCSSLNEAEIKIIHSLAEHYHPSIASASSSKKEDVVLCTEAGMKKLQERMMKITDVDMLDNAKDIEVARSHGDLRENQEFKAALQNRDRMQTEIQTLSAQLNRAKVLTKADIRKDRVGVGNRIEFVDEKGNHSSFSILGPFEADIEANIIAYTSQLAKDLEGKKVGDSFEFDGKSHIIEKITSLL